MFFNVDALYSFIELYKVQFMPIKTSIAKSKEILSNEALSNHYSEIGKNSKAFFEVLERLTKTYKNTQFNIYNTLIEEKLINISEKIILDKPFCNLLHFEKSSKIAKQQKLLIVAPLAGHHANLLTDSIASLLPSFDVYITDWKDASQVPLKFGSFDMDDYINYVIEFIKHLGKNLNIMAVCQPTVPVLAATSLLAEAKDINTPKSLILMGGPIDVRQNPTKVNKFALQHDIRWFENSVISTVPMNYPGFMRKVYPGFLQLAGFLSLNFEKHVESHVELFKDLVTDNLEEAEKQKKFYDRYLSVLDLPAEFYLQTIKEIFQDASLAKGTLVSRGRKIDPSTITNCSILCVEGEKDDITGIGQTKAALDLCSNLPKNKKHYHLQQGVGHYGIFSGGKFRRNIVPVISDFINNS
jgi:poly(3-hydroxybutyrate) depolymerase